MFLSKKKAAEQTASAVAATEDRYFGAIQAMQKDFEAQVGLLRTEMSVAWSSYRDEVAARLAEGLAEVRRDIPEIPIQVSVDSTILLRPLGEVTSRLGQRLDQLSDTVDYLVAAPVASVTTVLHEIREIVQLGQVLGDGPHQWVRPHGE